MRHFLKKEWHISDPNSSQRLLRWFLEEGSSSIYKVILPALWGQSDIKPCLNVLKEKFSDKLDSNRLKELETSATYFFGNLKAMRIHPVFSFHKRNLEKGIVAWDMARLITIARICFDLKYITEKDAWYYITSAYSRAKEIYSSWEDIATAYIIGRAGYNSGQAHGFDEAIALAEDALINKESPWNKISFQADEKISPQRLPKSIQNTKGMG